MKSKGWSFRCPFRDCLPPTSMNTQGFVSVQSGGFAARIAGLEVWFLHHHWPATLSHCNTIKVCMQHLGPGCCLTVTVPGNDFRQFVRDLLPQMNAWPMPNSVLVVDNASIHRVAGIRELVGGRGARLVYLPSYSPDLSPIGLTFSSVKAWLHANRARVNADLESNVGCLLGSCLFHYTRQSKRLVQPLRVSRCSLNFYYFL
jgi:DDE superfamily endonuclease